MNDLQHGEEFAGHRIESIAGRGGMGVVYRARQLDLDRLVALKLIAPSLALDAGFRERFIAESRAAAGIDHPNVIPVYYAGESDGRLYIAMRFVDGEDLRARVRREGRLDPTTAAVVINQVAAALDAAHARGLVHRDVKPANVLLGGGDHVYLTDFGLTKRMASHSANPTRAGGWVGSLGYVSPEQIRGGRVDARSDVYALGCVLYHALTGATPYQRESDEATLWAHLNDPPPSVSQVVGSVPPGFEDVVTRALAKDPDERFQSAGDLGRAAMAAAGQLEAAPPERLVAAGAAAPGGRAPSDGETVVSPEHAQTAQRDTSLRARRRRTRPRPAVLAGVAVLVVAAAGAVAAVLAGGSRQATTTATRPDTPQPSPIGTADAVVGAGRRPNAVALAGGRVWVASSDSSRITLLSSATGLTAQHSPQIGAGASAMDAGFGSVWVAKGNTQRLVRFDARSQSRRGGAVALPPGRAVAVAAGAGAVWVGSRAGANRPGTFATVAKVDPDTSSVTRVITLQRGLQNLAVGDGGLWVIDRNQRGVTRFDLATGLPSRPIPTGRGAYALAVGGGSVWVTNADDASVTRIDPRTRQHRDIPVGRQPAGIAIGGGRVWIANRLDGTLSALDVKTGRPAGQALPVGNNPFALTVRDGSVWVTLLADNAVRRVRF